MRAVHFSAIWLGITARVPDSFQTPCVGGKLFPLPRRAPEHWRPAFCDGEISWNGYYVSPNRRPPGSISATSSMKGASLGGNNEQDYAAHCYTRAGTSFSPNTCPQIRPVWKKPCSWQHSKSQTNVRVVWEAGDLPTAEWSATPFIMLLFHGVA